MADQGESSQAFDAPHNPVLRHQISMTLPFMTTGPKPGNAFAQKKEIKLAQQRLLQHAASQASLASYQSNRDFSLESREITVGVSRDIVGDLPSTPNTTMGMFTTPMEWADPLPRADPANLQRGVANVESGKPPPNHPSALPPPLFHGDEKGPAIGFLKSKVNKTTKEAIPEPAPPTLSTKALEILGGKGKEPAADHDREVSGSSAPDPYRLSSGSDSSVIHHNTRLPIPTKRWLLENKLVPRHQVSVTSDTSTETRQEEYVSTKPRIEGMMLSDSSLNPTKQGDYGKTNHGAVIHSVPSVKSMAATFMDFSPNSTAVATDRNSEEVLGSPTAVRHHYDNRPASDESGKVMYTPSVYNVPGGGAWETLQAQHPQTLPEFIVSPAEPPHRLSASTDGNNDEGPADSAAEAPNSTKRDRVDPGLTIVTTPGDLDAMEKAKIMAKEMEKQAAADMHASVNSQNTSAAAGFSKHNTNQGSISQSAPPGSATAYITIPQSHEHFTLAPQHHSTYSAPSIAKGPTNQIVQNQQGQFVHKGVRSVDRTFQQSPFTTTAGGFSPLPPAAGYQSQGTLGEHVTSSFQIAHYHLDQGASSLHSHIQNAKDQTIDAYVRRSDQAFQAHAQQHNQLKSQMADVHNKLLQESSSWARVRNDMKQEFAISRRQHQELMSYLHNEFQKVNNRIWSVNDRVTDLVCCVDLLENRFHNHPTSIQDSFVPTTASAPPPVPISRNLTPMLRLGLSASQTQASIASTATVVPGNTGIRNNTVESTDPAPRSRANTAVRNSADENVAINGTPNKARSPRKKAGGFFNKKTHSRKGSNDENVPAAPAADPPGFTPYVHPNPHKYPAGARGSKDPETVHPAYREEYIESQRKMPARDIRLEESEKDGSADVGTITWPSIGGNHVGWSGGNWYHHEQVSGEKTTNAEERK